MWRDIFLTNRGQVLAALDEFDEALMQLRDLVDLGDRKGLERFFTSARARRETTIARVIHDRRLAAE